MALDVDRARAETRGLENQVHLNNAGAALMPAPVADRLRAFLTAEERFGGYETAAAEQAALLVLLVGAGEHAAAARGRLLERLVARLLAVRLEVRNKPDSRFENLGPDQVLPTLI